MRTLKVRKFRVGTARSMIFCFHRPSSAPSCPAYCCYIWFDRCSHDLPVFFSQGTSLFYNIYSQALLTCVCPLMSLKRLLSGKHSVADVTADAAGRSLPFAYELPYGVSPWTPSADTILTAGIHIHILH